MGKVSRTYPHEKLAFCVFMFLTVLLLLFFLGERIEWRQLRDFLNLAQKASAKRQTPSDSDDVSDDKVQKSRQTINLFYRFLTSKTGLFLKRPLVYEIAEAIDGKFVNVNSN